MMASETTSNQKLDEKPILSEFIYNEILTGEPHLKVVRKDYSNRKTISQRYHNGFDWVPGGKKSDVYPYKFEEWKNHPKVYFVEGEKCAERLINLGLKATTVPGGANAWDFAYSSTFEGKDVVIIPDNDSPGQRFATHAGTDIQSFALSVRILELPGLDEAEDVVDWLERGGTVKNLSTMPTKDIFEWISEHEDEDVFDCRKLSDVEPKEVEWLWEPYIPRGEITMVEGDPECGKSWFTMAIASALSNGRGPVDSKPSIEGSTLLFACEDSLSKVQANRFKSMGANLKNIYSVPDPINLNDEGFKKLESTLNRVKPTLLIFNPIQAYIGNKDMNNAGDVRSILSKIQQISEQFRLATIIVRHLKKGSEKSAYKGMGSIDFFAASRSVLMIGRNPENQAQGAIIQSKCNLGPRGVNLGFQLEESGYCLKSTTDLTYSDIMASDLYGGENKSALDEAKEFLLEELKYGPVKSRTIFNGAKQLGISESTLKRARKELKLQKEKVHDSWLMMLPSIDQQDQDGQKAAHRKMTPLASFQQISPEGDI